MKNTPVADLDSWLTFCSLAKIDQHTVNDQKLDKEAECVCAELLKQAKEPAELTEAL